MESNHLYSFSPSFPQFLSWDPEGVVVNKEMNLSFRRADKKPFKGVRKGQVRNTEEIK